MNGFGQLVTAFGIAILGNGKVDDAVGTAGTRVTLGGCLRISGGAGLAEAVASGVVDIAAVIAPLVAPDLAETASAVVAEVDIVEGVVGRLALAEQVAQIVIAQAEAVDAGDETWEILRRECGKSV